MRISRLRVLGIQRLDDLELRPAPGLTVVRGPNESGKSTIRRAIEVALYGRSHDAESQLRGWGGGDRAPAVVELDVEADGEEETSFRVVRTLAPGSARLELHVPEGQLEGDAAERRLQELTGVPSLAFFRSTAVIDQSDMTGLGRDDATLKSRLAATVSAGDRAFARNMRDLESHVAAIDGAGLPAPGPLAAAEAEVARLAGAVAQGEEALASQLADQEALWAAQSRLAEIDAQLESDRELLATSEEAVRLLDRQRDAEGRYERFHRAVVVRDEIETLDHAHPSSLPLAVLREGTAKLGELDKTIADLTAELADEVTVSGDIMRPAPRWRAFTLIGVLLAASGVAIAALLPAYQLIGVVVAVAGVASAFIGMRRRRLAFDVGYQRHMRDEQISRRLRGRSVIEDQLRHAQKAREAQLAGLGVNDVDAAQAMLAAEQAHVDRLDALHAEFASLLGDPPVTEDVAVLRDRAAAEAEVCRHALSQMGEIGEDPPGNRMRYGAAVSAGESAMVGAVKTAAGARARLEANRADSGAVAGLVEQLADATLARDRLARRRRVLAGTAESLRAAEKATMREAARFVEARMGRDIERITAGRYRRVEVDETDLSIRLWSPERRDWVDARALSEGTLAQAFLAARLALARQVTGDRRLPLVLDDPLVSFDEDRATRTIELLRSIAPELQVIHLTTSDRFDRQADQVVQLPAPRETDARSPAGDGV